MPTTNIMVDGTSKRGPINITINAADIEEAQGISGGPSVADIDVTDDKGNITRFFISAGVKNGRVFVEVASNVGEKSVRKQVFGSKRKSKKK